MTELDPSSVSAPSGAADSATRRHSRRSQFRSAGILVAVGVLAASVVVPTVGALSQPTSVAGASTQTLHQAAIDGSQSFVAGSDVAAADVARGGYAATTSDELAVKQAEEAAIARAKADAEAAIAAAASSSGSSNSPSADVAIIAPGTGAVGWPLRTYSSIGDGLGARGGTHDGVDLLAPAMTPIYASHAGTVTVSSESFWGYGVCVEITGTVGGTTIMTTYAHMTYNTRQVQVGEQVQPGQLIGYVGSTGNSSANHLHFEVQQNGSLVDPLAWLAANAG